MKEKEANHYYQAFFKADNLVDNLATFNCYCVEKNPINNKWEKVKDDPNSEDFLTQ